MDDSTSPTKVVASPGHPVKIKNKVNSPYASSSSSFAADSSVKGDRSVLSENIADDNHLAIHGQEADSHSLLGLISGQYQSREDYNLQVGAMPLGDGQRVVSITSASTNSGGDDAGLARVAKEELAITTHDEQEYCSNSSSGSEISSGNSSSETVSSDEQKDSEVSGEYVRARKNAHKRRRHKYPLTGGDDGEADEILSSRGAASDITDFELTGGTESLLSSDIYRVSQQQLDYYRQHFLNLVKGCPPMNPQLQPDSDESTILQAARLSRDVGRDFLAESRLEKQILRQIWDLADYDADGQLCFGEFVIAFHLAVLCTQKIVPRPPSDLPEALHRFRQVLPANFSTTLTAQDKSQTLTPDQSLVAPSPVMTQFTNELPADMVVNGSSVPTPGKVTKPAAIVARPTAQHRSSAEPSEPPPDLPPQAICPPIPPRRPNDSFSSKADLTDLQNVNLLNERRKALIAERLELSQKLHHFRQRKLELLALLKQHNVQI